MIKNKRRTLKGIMKIGHSSKYPNKYIEFLKTVENTNLKTCIDKM